jgi:CheY-like chemotaxis protein
MLCSSNGSLPSSTAFIRAESSDLAAHGGTISAENIYGSVITAVIPARPGPAMIRVLIVEDDPLIAEAHRQYTERIGGFAVHATAGTGNAAIDLVLLDIGLPDASGIRRRFGARRHPPAPDIIAISSERDLAVVRSAVAHGVAMYLLKPFSFAAFRDKLEHYRGATFLPG